ncbi:MAG: PH domain-containing protein [Sphingomonadaceae bacterium]|nr:PH domain-containing protein [Sphingomonadaceae bacterium]
MTASHVPPEFASSEDERPVAGAQSHGVSSSHDTNGSGHVEGHRLDIKGLFVGFVTGLPQLVFPIFAAFFGTRGTDNPLIQLIAVGAILFFSFFFRWIGWLRFRYHVGEHDVRIESGVLSRNARSIPYERIQDVSIEQKPLARIMGLGEVKFETGGGEGEDAKLSFVSLEEADRLREVVRARKAGWVEAEAIDGNDQADMPPIFAMDGNRVFTFGLYSFSLVIFAILGGIAQQFDFLLPYDLWDISHWIGLAEKRGVSVDDLNGIGWTARLILAAGALGSLIFIGLLTGVIRTMLREHGFRLDRTAKGFRRRRGLLTLTDAVMPSHRVQAAVIQTGPIRKRRGWHALKFVSLAQDSKEESNFVAAPFATLAEIWPIANAAAIGAPDSSIRFRKGRLIWWLNGFFALVAAMIVAMIATMVFADAPLSMASRMLFVPLLLLPIWWLEWRCYGDATDASQLYVRNGWWRQSLIIAPQIKVQTIEIAQGPIARMLGLASLHFGIAGGRLEMVALPLETARKIRNAVMEKVVAVDYSAINRSP